MGEARFWRIIDNARGTSDPMAPTVLPSALAQQLSGMADADVLSFEVRFSDEMTRLNRWPLWAAGFVASGGLGDDEFYDFRAWLIGKGRVVVDQAVTDPDGLASYLTDADWATDQLGSEELPYAIYDVVAARFGQSRSDDFLAKVQRNENRDPLGEPFDEEIVDAQFPRLHDWAIAQGTVVDGTMEPSSGP